MPAHILLARQRSGTGALGSLLESHPEISYLGELFHPDEITNKNNYFNFLLSKVKTDSNRALPINNQINYDEFLAHVESSERKNNVIIDIKYSCTHHFNGYFQPTFSIPKLLLFAQYENRKILHLKRKNLLKTFISGQLAEKNKVWHAKNTDLINFKTLEINSLQLLNYLRSTTVQVDTFDSYLRRYTCKLDLEYEELFDGNSKLSREASNRIALFLNIESQSFENFNPQFVKQTSDNLEDVIINFTEISNALKNTEYRWMLGN